MDLPTTWNLYDKSSYLSVDSSGLRVIYEGDEYVGAIRANHPIPPQCKLFYFEVDIIDEGKNKVIGIGFCEKAVNLNGMPGWYDGSWGYHGDDGNLFCCSVRGNPYGSLFSAGDTIGCCLNFKENIAFYTKNGISLGIAFRNLKGILYPCVGLRSQGGSIEVNFGNRKFKFAVTASNDMVDESLKNKWIEAFNMCINTTNVYTLEDLENLLKIKQDTALKFRVKFNFIMGGYEDAIIDLTKLLDIEQNSKFALRYRGEAYHLMGRCKEAIIDLTKLLDIEPNSKFALRYLGEVYHLTKEAIIDLARLLGIELNDDIDESLKKKFIEAFNLCNNVTNIYSLEDLENLLEIKQDSALKFRVKFNFTMERYEDAIVDLTKLLDIEPNSKFALRHRGEAYYITGRCRNAIIDLTKLLNIEPNNKFALRYLGEAYHLTKEAIIDLAKLFGIEPSDDIDELFKKKLIDAFNMCNNTTNTYTLEDLKNLLEIKQDTALKFRVKFNFIMGRHKDAINDLTKLLDIEPNNKFALRYRAETYYQMEKYKESFNDVNKLLKIGMNDEWASKLLAKIIEKDPCVDGTYELGYFYLHVEKDEYKAFAQFEKSANMGNIKGINCLGYCYEYGIGVEQNENKAFTYYQKSVDMYNSNGMYQVGYCYYLGIGVGIDKHKAFTYYLKSAEAGNSMGIRKTAICYYYGIGVKKNRDKYYEWIKKDPLFLRDSFDLCDLYYLRYFDRFSEYGKCAHCNENNTQPAWCISCDPDTTTRWTSRNKNIDDCMKTFQLRTKTYEDEIEWIPFDRLSDVEVIGKGGFGLVYKAIWLDGIRQIKKIKIDKNNNSVDDNNNFIYKRARESNSIVALKTLLSDSLKEFNNHMKCNMYGSELRIYGLTHDIENNRYLMVFQYADKGNLHIFLGTNFQDLSWRIKLKLLKDISLDLLRIHIAGYTHSDLYSGNILQDQHFSTALQSYITDLGLSKKNDENDSEDYIYSVMPYVAPEVLLGQKFTKAADIYSFGVIMSEMSTGQRPFDGYQFDESLAINIIYNGLQPEFASGTPDCYIALAKQCMDLDLEKRPSAYDISKKLSKWINIIEDSYEEDSDEEDSDEDADEIKRQFLDADKIVKTLPLNLPKHPDMMYVSKIINTKKLSIAINASKPMDFVEISNNSI